MTLILPIKFAKVKVVKDSQWWQNVEKRQSHTCWFDNFSKFEMHIQSEHIERCLL